MRVILALAMMAVMLWLNNWAGVMSLKLFKRRIVQPRQLKMSLKMVYKSQPSQLKSQLKMVRKSQLSQLKMVCHRSRESRVAAKNCRTQTDGSVMSTCVVIDG